MKTEISNKNQMINPNEIYPVLDSGFSQAVIYNDSIITSGIVGWKKDFSLPNNGSFSDQLIQVFANLEDILAASNKQLNDIVHLRFYVKCLQPEYRMMISLKLQDTFCEAYRPATTLIGVHRLAHEKLLIEIEAIINNRKS